MPMPMPMPRAGPGRPVHAPPHVQGPWSLRPRGRGGGARRGPSERAQQMGIGTWQMDHGMGIGKCNLARNRARNKAQLYNTLYLGYLFLFVFHLEADFV